MTGKRVALEVVSEGTGQAAQRAGHSPPKFHVPALLPHCLLLRPRTHQTAGGRLPGKTDAVPLGAKGSRMGSPCGAQLPVCLPWSHADPQPCALRVGRLITAQAQTVPRVASDAHQVNMGPPLPLASHPGCSHLGRTQTPLPPALHWPVRCPEGREVTVPSTQQPA